MRNIIFVYIFGEEITKARELQKRVIGELSDT